jgi:hypothetical protein
MRVQRSRLFDADDVEAAQRMAPVRFAELATFRGPGGLAEPPRASHCPAASSSVLAVPKSTA